MRTDDPSAVPYLDGQQRIADMRPAMPAGRPTNYRRQFCDDLIAAATAGFSLTAFAGQIGTHRDVIWDWGQRFPEFGDTIKRAKAIRTAAWEKIALDIANGRDAGGKGQAVMTIFGLKNADPEEWRDRQIIEHDISDRVADRLESARQRMLGQLNPGDGAKLIEAEAQHVVPADVSISGEQGKNPDKALKQSNP